MFCLEDMSERVVKCCKIEYKQLLTNMLLCSTALELDCFNYVFLYNRIEQMLVNKFVLLHKTLMLVSEKITDNYQPGIEPGTYHLLVVCSTN